MNRPGVENADCVQIREIKVQRNRVYLYAVPYAHDTRAMGGPVLELFLSSPKMCIRDRPMTMPGFAQWMWMRTLEASRSISIFGTPAEYSCFFSVLRRL